MFSNFDPEQTLDLNAEFDEFPKPAVVLTLSIINIINVISIIIKHVDS